MKFFQFDKSLLMPVDASWCMSIISKWSWYKLLKVKVFWNSMKVLKIRFLLIVDKRQIKLIEVYGSQPE